MGQKPTSKVKLIDIARKTGLSLMTVSRVIGNRPYVKAETRETVLRIANEMGYTPHATARALASGHTKMIGLVVGSIHSEYLLEIIRGVTDGTREQGYNLVLVTSGHNDKHELTQVSHLMGGFVDGILLVLPREADRYLQLVDHHQLPCVLIDHRHMNISLPMVRATNREGMYEATRYLIQLGHRKIGYIKGIDGDGTTVERYQGFLQALAEAGIHQDFDLVKQGDYESGSGRNCTRELFSLNQRPTAIIASNDQMAFGVITAAQEFGLNIPEDLSVIGFDDIPTASRIYPPLTTVHQPLYEMGKESVGMVIEAINGTIQKEVVRILPTRLVIRTSTRMVRESQLVG